MENHQWFKIGCCSIIKMCLQASRKGDNPIPHIPAFWCICSRRHLKKMWQMGICSLWAISLFDKLFSNSFLKVVCCRFVVCGLVLTIRLMSLYDILYLVWKVTRYYNRNQYYIHTSLHNVIRYSEDCLTRFPQEYAFCFLRQTHFENSNHNWNCS